MSSYGLAWQAGYGSARCSRYGVLGFGRRGTARRGKARRGAAWQGRAGKARLGAAGPGKARHGEAGRVSIYRGIFMDNLYQAMKALLEDIYETDPDHRIRASVVLDRSRPNDAPTHGCFEWDDNKIAEEARLNQSRHWIRRIPIEVRKIESQLKHVPCSIHTLESREGYYKPAVDIVSGSDEFHLALEEASMRFKSAIKSVYVLVKLSKKNGDDKHTSVLLMIEQALNTWNQTLASLH